MDFIQLLRDKLKLIHLDQDLLNRPVNEGFSGGEKKRNEIFQMAVLEPRLAILDETDSGLDIDALRVVADGVNALRSPERAILLVTHYQRLLNYIVPDRVHVLQAGRIVKSATRAWRSSSKPRAISASKAQARRALRVLRVRIRALRPPPRALDAGHGSRADAAHGCHCRSARSARRTFRRLGAASERHAGMAR
jgi:ABC-type multidrug transport system ATPase subunit